MATGSPTNDTSPSASANGQLWSSPVPEFEMRIMRRCFSTGARSSSVSTATTPGIARAALGIDAADQRVRMRAAHEGRMQRARRSDVVDEARTAGQQRLILEPRDARSDQLAHWPSLEIALAARAMTSFGVA